MRMRRQLVLGALAGLIATPALAAPRELYNKTIIITWGEGTMQKTPDGRTINPTLHSERIVYVSSAGRVFVKGNRNAAGRREPGNQYERGPGEGNQGTLAFQGNQLVGHAEFSGFARQVTVSFDANYSSCTAKIVYGKSGGPTTWKGFDGRTYEIMSITVNSPSCTVRDGNTLASQ